MKLQATILCHGNADLVENQMLNSLQTERDLFSSKTKTTYIIRKPSSQSNGCPPKETNQFFAAVLCSNTQIEWHHHLNGNFLCVPKEPVCTANLAGKTNSGWPPRESRLLSMGATREKHSTVFLVASSDRNACQISPCPNAVDSG